MANFDIPVQLAAWFEDIARTRTVFGFALNRNQRTDFCLVGRVYGYYKRLVKSASEQAVKYKF